MQLCHLLYFLKNTKLFNLVYGSILSKVNILLFNLIVKCLLIINFPLMVIHYSKYNYGYGN